MSTTKIQPGGDLHLTVLMARHSLNFVTGTERAALLAYGRDVFTAGAEHAATPGPATPVQIQALYRARRALHAIGNTYNDSELRTRALEADEEIDRVLAAAPQSPAAIAVDDDPLGLRDVGEALMQAIERNTDALKAVGWLGPMDCPSEIVVDLLNLLDEAKAEAALSQAVRDVLAERRRQVEAEGYDTEHDDAHVMGEIGALAALYLMPDAARDWDATSTTYGATLGQALLPEGWTMPKMGEDRRRDLVKGIACGLAELERRDRVSAQANGGSAA